MSTPALPGHPIFVTANTAVPMLELSDKYAAATSKSQKLLLAAAGEAVLATGEHGGLSVFTGFLLPTIAGLGMSFVVLSAGIFSRQPPIWELPGTASC